MYRFSYYATGLSNMEKVRKALFMFVDLFGLERYNYEKLVNFMVTVKTNYRSGPVLTCCLISRYCAGPWSTTTGHTGSTSPTASTASSRPRLAFTLLMRWLLLKLELK